MPGMSDLHVRNEKKAHHLSGRRRFLGKLAAVPFIGSLAASSHGAGLEECTSLKRVNALLVSATTMAGGKSLEHAEEGLKILYKDIQRILLINFASLPPARDAYAARMQRDFSRIDARFKVDSLHASSLKDAGKVLKDAEAVYVSGGNTFLLLRELYDRDAVDLLRERILGGMPYSGASAGSNLAGINIGTTNDFPLVDVPTRRALGILPAIFNPHHPDPDAEKEFASRQYKIGQYTRYHPTEAVVGVNNAGMISIRGDQLSLKGAGGYATVQLDDKSELVSDKKDGNISRAISRLREEESQ